MAAEHEATVPYVRAAAQTQQLPIAAEHLPGVLRFFALAAAMSERVMGLPLTPADESGSVFKPVEPAGPEA